MRGMMEWGWRKGRVCGGNDGVGLEEGVGLEGAESEEGMGYITKIELKIWDQ